jgi:hypothetical protein
MIKYKEKKLKDQNEKNLGTKKRRRNAYANPH